MSLLKLSTEPLQLITQELAIWELAALVCTCEEAKRIFKTTSSVVKAKMPGCVRMERLNKLITSFRFLLEVSIGDGGTMPHLCAGHIIYLPSTVITLKLNCKEAFQCFKRGFSAWQPISARDPFAKLSVVKIKESLSNLRTLIVISSEETVDPHDLIPGLPATITYLRLQETMFPRFYLDDSISRRCFECPHELPPNLVVLKLPRCKQLTGNASLEHLVHLQTLTLPFCADVPRLPPSITRLHLKDLPKEIKLIEQVPDLLSLNLFCEALPSDFEFPKHLTTFKLPIGTMQMKSRESVFPSTITRLCLKHIVVDQPFTSRQDTHRAPILPKVNIVWPPQLKRLEFGAQAEISQLEALPSTLEYTTLTIKDLSLASVNRLPKRLTVLRISDYLGETAGQYVDLASALPNLRDCLLITAFRGPPRKIAFPHNLLNLTISSLTPPLLNQEDEVSFTEQQNDWPPFLRQLQLSEHFSPTDSGLEHLPRTLTTLQLQFRHETIRFSHVGLSHLPNTITALRIHAHIEHILPDWLHHLPSCLRCMTLDYYDGMRDAHVASLPRCLEQIDMKNSIQLTDACLPYLPPALYTLRLRRNRHLTLKLLELLPRKQTSYRKFTIYLPKNINFPKRMKNIVPPTVEIFTAKLRYNHN